LVGSFFEPTICFYFESSSIGPQANLYKLSNMQICLKATIPAGVTPGPIPNPEVKNTAGIGLVLLFKVELTRRCLHIILISLFQQKLKGSSQRAPKTPKAKNLTTSSAILLA